MTLKPLILGAVGLLALLLVAGVGYFSLRASNRPVTPPPHSMRPDDPQVLRVGARIYAQQCAACMGPRARASPTGVIVDRMTCFLRRRTIPAATLGTIPTSNCSPSLSRDWPN